jgi:adenosylhomocysteine nucleosidase
MFARTVNGDGAVTRVDDGLLLCVCGAGATRAESAAQCLVANGASALLSWGVCGALVTGLEAGTLLVPGAIIDSDGTALPVSSAWRDRLNNVSSLDVRPIAETRSLLATPAQKHALARSRHAIAADMESAAVAKLARQARVPFLAVRAVADDCAMSVPAWLTSCMDARGRIELGTFRGLLLRNPRDVNEISSLARGFGAALAALRRFREHHLHQLLITS